MGENRRLGNPAKFRNLEHLGILRRESLCRRLASLPRFLLSWTGLAVMALLPPAVSGQSKVPQTPRIIKVAIDGKAAPEKEVDLRPNTPTELGFELNNLLKEDLRDVTLKLFQVVDSQDNRPVAEAKVPKLDEDTKHVVQIFQIIKGSPDKEILDKTKDGPDKVELAGSPPFKLQLQIQTKNQPLMKRDLTLVVREPKDYVSPTVEFDPKSNVLHAAGTTKDGAEVAFIGPHQIPVELVLGRDVTPPKSAVFGQTLTRPTDKLALEATEFTFERMGTEGDVYLKVDGYDRAFTYRVKEGGDKRTINSQNPGQIRVRIGVRRFTAANAELKVPLEVDGPLTGDYKVLVGLDRTGENKELPESDVRKYVGLRQQKVTLSSPAGKLVCRYDVSDWLPQFDTRMIKGRSIWFRVTVLKGEMPVELKVDPESRPLWAKTETAGREKNGAFARVDQDESAPEGIKLELPKDNEWPVGTSLELRASIKGRTLSQAPIEKVILFRGKVPKDEKIKDDDILETIESPDPKEKEWKFTLPPQAKPEPLTLSVQFMTVTKVKASGGTGTIFFKPAAAAAKKLYMIKGQVVRGDLGQSDVEVTLMDAKRNVKATTKTKAKGAFVFENVEPGAYIVASSDKSFQKLSGETKPFVVPDKDKKELDVTVSLLLAK